MRKPKSYVATVQAGSQAMHAPNEVQPTTVFEIQVDPTWNRRFDYGAWMGRGIDAWIWSGVEILRSIAGSGAVTPRTIVNYGGGALPKWFAFLTDTGGPARPQDLTPGHVKKYVSWLKLKHPNHSTARTYYANITVVLMAMLERGFIECDIALLFPIMPFRITACGRRGATALSGREVERLAGALKKDLIAIHRREFEAPDSHALVAAFLMVALRTGVNTTPLLEASRNCLSPNPFMPNMMVMKTFKRRARGGQLHALRKSDADHDTAVIPMDGVAVLMSVIARTEDIVKEAPTNIRDRIWLYRSRSRQNFGAILALNDSRLSMCIRDFAGRHQLMGDDGKLLVPTPQRLRKTMEAKLWGLSGGDLVAVAAAVGHTPDVADRHYLSLTEEMKSEAARFVGLALPVILRGSDPAHVSMPPSIRKTILNTPVGRCANSEHGKNAPKNGVDRCDRFTECMTCPTFVVVGSVKDLHRLFSFQLFMLAEIEYMRGPELAQWRDLKRRTISLIDQFTAAKFAHSVVSEAKALALKAPHPFWAARMRTVAIANGGPHGGQGF